MTLITAPAVRIEQDGRPIFLTRFTVNDFLSPGFYRVAEFEANTADGYQRVMDERRARRFAKDIEELGDNAFLPTSVFLATDKELDYDTDKREISFHTNEADPFFLIVDGQHRAAGLGIAAKKVDRESLQDFPVAAVVATGLHEADQMVQFLIVNSTQKKVSPDIGQQILAQFTSLKGVENLPDLPGWIRTQIDLGVDHKALALVRYLNESSNSPWCGRIRMANEEKTPRKTANQSMFVESVKRQLFTRTHRLALEQDENRRRRMLENYWRAVTRCILGSQADDEIQDNPLFKSIGVDLFHQASVSVFGHLARLDNFTEDDFFECLVSVRESDALNDEDREMFRPEFWKKGGRASGLNKSSVRRLAAALSDAIAQIEEDDDDSNIIA